MLRVYELQLELEQTKLAQALAREQTILKLINERAEEVQRQNEAIRRALELRSGDLRVLSTYNLSAQAQQVVWHEDLTRIRRYIRDQRQIVVAHERKVKLVLKLKERKLGEWTHAAERQFEAECQELWLAGHVQKCN